MRKGKKHWRKKKRTPSVREKTSTIHLNCRKTEKTGENLRCETCWLLEDHSGHNGNTICRVNIWRHKQNSLFETSARVKNLERGKYYMHTEMGCWGKPDSPDCTESTKGTSKITGQGEKTDELLGEKFITRNSTNTCSEVDKLENKRNQRILWKREVAFGCVVTEKHSNLFVDVI